MIGKSKKMLEFSFTNEEKFFIRGNFISRMKDQFTKFAKVSSSEIFPINHKCHKPLPC